MGVIRILLAVTVVISHNVNLFGLTFVGSVLAVQCFYIISGFYMGLVLEKKYDLSHYKLFITNRFLRLFPIYGAVVLLMISSSFIWHRFSEQHSNLFFDRFFANFSKLPFLAACFVLFSNLFMVFQDLFLFIGLNSQHHLEFIADFKSAGLPLSNFLIVPQAWTVGMEILFYFLVPFLSRLKVAWLVTIAVISLGLRLVWYAHGYNFDPWTYRFFPFELVFFILGLLVFKIYTGIRTKRINTFYGNAVFIFIVSLIGFYQFISMDNDLKYIMFIIIFSAALPVLFIRFKNNKFDRWIGEFSYPVYICHVFVIIIVNIFSSKFGVKNEIVVPLITLIVTFILAYLLNKFIGEPVDRYRKKRVLITKR